MIEVTILDDCEMKVQIQEEFCITRDSYYEFKEKLERLIEEYRI
ncbi:hypothetical protein [Biomaibacter acetigenes]|nr:hypothetical protein [Biomaibacter acetigenes]